MTRYIDFKEDKSAFSALEKTSKDNISYKDITFFDTTDGLLGISACRTSSGAL